MKRITLLLILSLIVTAWTSHAESTQKEILVCKVRLRNCSIPFNLFYTINEYTFVLNKSDMIKFIENKHINSRDQYLKKYYLTALKTTLSKKGISYITDRNRIIRSMNESNCIKEIFYDYINTGLFKILDSKTKRKIQTSYLKKYKFITKSIEESDFSTTETEVFKLPNDKIIFTGRLKAAIGSKMPKQKNNEK